MKLLIDLANVNETIKNEDKMLVMLSSFSDDDYETSVLTLIICKSLHSYDKIFSALVNHELKRKDKESSSNILAETLTARGRSSK